jgi:hypothetical protein
MSAPDLAPPELLLLKLVELIDIARDLEEPELARDLEKVKDRLWNRYPFSPADTTVRDALREVWGLAAKGKRPWPSSQIQFAAYLKERGTPLSLSAISKALKRQGVTLKGKPPGRPPKK